MDSNGHISFEKVCMWTEQTTYFWWKVHLWTVSQSISVHIAYGQPASALFGKAFVKVDRPSLLFPRQQLQVPQASRADKREGVEVFGEFFWDVGHGSVPIRG